MEVKEMERSEVYDLKIDQKGEIYKAAVEVTEGFSPTTENVRGKIIESNYPIKNGWIDKPVIIRTNKTIRVPGDIFGKIGTIVTIEEEGTFE